MSSLMDRLILEIAEMQASGTLRKEQSLLGPQGPVVEVKGRGEVIMLTSNNYLGLANHPEIVAAAEHAESEWGYGLASVRFICGTQEIHKELEAKIASFLGTDATILYGSCWNANEGLFQTILGEEDAVFSDELNHASIIDGIRLAKCRKLRYRNRDTDDLRRLLEENRDARSKLIVTDGVFSMEGSLAPLPELVSLAREFDGFLVVDDSHGTGVLGRTGRGTAEELGVFGDIHAYTSTLGKALGGSHGGFTTGPGDLVEFLRQRSRPYLFSNTLPPAVVVASIRAIELLEKDDTLIRKLASNTRHFRTKVKELGLEVRPGNHPIVPIIIGDTAKAIAMSRRLLDQGVYVSGFGFPVVPQGQARLRCQISAAHEIEHLDRAVTAISDVAAEFGIGSR
ncbi:MAG: glycine C-acetyltransferase [Acidobacteria bacterium]|nr:glycine C-acetyltransferase [Acidobacteriota bacterium]